MREVTLKVGEPYSEAARMASQRALNSLEVFRLVKVSLDAWLPGETSARVVVAVEEASSTTYEFGGGVEAGSYPHALPESEGGGIVDRIIFAPRASVGFARTNIGGHNRTLTMFGRLSLKPKTTDESGIGSPDYRAIATYRERYAFGLKSDLLLSATAEQGLRTSYNFIKRVDQRGIPAAAVAACERVEPVHAGMVETIRRSHSAKRAVAGRPPVSAGTYLDVLRRHCLGPTRRSAPVDPRRVGGRELRFGAESLRIRGRVPQDVCGRDPGSIH